MLCQADSVKNDHFTRLELHIRNQAWKERFLPLVSCGLQAKNTVASCVSSICPKKFSGRSAWKPLPHSETKGGGEVCARKLDVFELKQRGLKWQVHADSAWRPRVFPVAWSCHGSHMIGPWGGERVGGGGGEGPGSPEGCQGALPPTVTKWQRPWHTWLYKAPPVWGRGPGPPGRRPRPKIHGLHEAASCKRGRKSTIIRIVKTNQTDTSLHDAANSRLVRFSNVPAGRDGTLLDQQLRQHGKPEVFPADLQQMKQGGGHLQTSLRSRNRHVQKVVLVRRWKNSENVSYHESKPPLQPDWCRFSLLPHHLLRFCLTLTWRSTCWRLHSEVVRDSYCWKLQALGFVGRAQENICWKKIILDVNMQQQVQWDQCMRIIRWRKSGWKASEVTRTDCSI